MFCHFDLRLTPTPPRKRPLRALAWPAPELHLPSACAKQAINLQGKGGRVFQGITLCILRFFKRFLPLLCILGKHACCEDENETMAGEDDRVQLHQWAELGGQSKKLIYSCSTLASKWHFSCLWV